MNLKGGNFASRKVLNCFVMKMEEEGVRQQVACWQRSCCAHNSSQSIELNWLHKTRTRRRRCWQHENYNDHDNEALQKRAIRGIARHDEQTFKKSHNFVIIDDNQQESQHHQHQKQRRKRPRHAASPCWRHQLNTLAAAAGYSLTTTTTILMLILIVASASAQANVAATAQANAPLLTVSQVAAADERQQIPTNSIQQQPEVFNNIFSNKTNNPSQDHQHLSQLTKRSPAASGGGGGGGPTNFRVSEADLLPFSAFVVAQPAFSDIMKSWPPTTRRANVAHNKQYDSSKTARQRAHQASLAQQRRPSSSSSGAHERQVAAAAAAAAGDDQLVRNHLNEDYDDTIVTADESFELEQLPEPPTWVNYLGELGDFIYTQLKQYFDSSPMSPFFQSSPPLSQPNNATIQHSTQYKFNVIDDLLDDFYYDQYENSQVLYYGPQLVREGDIFEIGCYLPANQPSEWTKSGKILRHSGNNFIIDDVNKNNNEHTPAKSTQSSQNIDLQQDTHAALRLVKRTVFLNAKQNYSLKVFEAQLSDSGNYRCNRMSRKYHKLIVVPQRVSLNQLYLIQQRLLSVVQPELVSSSPSARQVQLATLYTSSRGGSGSGGSLQAKSSGSKYSIQASQEQQHQSSSSSRQAASNKQRAVTHMPAAHLINENQPLLFACNITDEFVLRRLRDTPSFQLEWYKNGKLLRSSGGGGTRNNTSTMARNSHQQTSSRSQQSMQASTQRVQQVGANGRQLFISSAQYSDAGDYLCSWSKLLIARQVDDDESQHDSQRVDNNPLAAASLHQVLAPVKLRPFKSVYHVRAGNQLRLVCQAQRGYPAAQINWYIGNRLVDADYLRTIGDDEIQIIQMHGLRNLIASNPIKQQQQGNNEETDSSWQAQIVEINPIPSGRQQMQLTANGRGQWVEYRDLTADKYSIDTHEKQARYLQSKLTQLTGINLMPAGGGGGGNEAQSSFAHTTSAPLSSSSSSSSQQALLLQQATLSVLIVNKLQHDKHTSRYACRATTRANTDEVTTVIKVEDASTIVLRPKGNAATLIPGQSLHFECAQIGRRDAQFVWYKRALGDNEAPVLLEPNTDDNIEIYNERLTLLKPNYQAVGDYICRALKEDKSEDERESATIRVRAQPFIDDFGLATSHTGKSVSVTDGERLELVCRVPDTSTPVNITWLRSDSPDDERAMIQLPEWEPNRELSSPNSGTPTPLLVVPTYTAPSAIMVERVDNFTRKLVVESVGAEHRGFYACLVDNGVTERSRKIVLVRVKDRIVAVWPFLGILAELFILFTIIYVWETQKAQKAVLAPANTLAPAINKQRPVGVVTGPESVPLNR